MTLDDLERAWRHERSPEAGAAYVAALTTRLNESPRDASLRLRLGVTLYALDEVDRAIPELQKAKGDATTAAEAGYYLAYCFVKKKLAKLAVKELEQVLARAPRPLEGVARDAAYLAGRICEMAGKKEQAIEHYRLIADRPFDPPRGDLGGALAALRPTDPPRRPPDTPSAGASLEVSS